MNTLTMTINDTSTPTWQGFDLFRLTPRINRLKFAGLFLFWLSVIIAPDVFSDILFQSKLLSCLIAPIWLTALINVLFLKIRRLNDLNWSGLTLALFIIIPIGFMLLLVLLLKPGTAGANKYGAAPATASWHYNLFILLFVALMGSIVTADYLGLTAKLMNWQTYNTSTYSIQFPGKYTVSNLEIEGIPYTEAEYKSKDMILDIDTIDYSQLTSSEMKALLERIGLHHSFAESLNLSTSQYVKNILIASDQVKNFTVMQDLPLSNTSIRGRELKVFLQRKTDGDEYVKSNAFIDEKHKIYYHMTAYYSDDSSTNKTVHVVDMFFASFKLNAA